MFLLRTLLRKKTITVSKNLPDLDETAAIIRSLTSKLFAQGTVTTPVICGYCIERDQIVLLKYLQFTNYSINSLKQRLMRGKGFATLMTYLKKLVWVSGSLFEGESGHIHP